MNKFIIGLTIVLLIIVAILRLSKDEEKPIDNGLIVEQLLNVILARPLHEYYSRHNSFPESQESFMAEVNKLRAANGYEPMSGIPDPWKNPVNYVFPGKVNVGAYDLVSYGVDGKASDDDIINHFVADVWPPPVNK